MGNAYSSSQPKSQFLARRFLIKHYSNIPVLLILLGTTAFQVATLIWMYNTRDIVIDRSKKPINERMDLLRPYLLRAMSVSDDLRPAPELYVAYEEMKEEEKRREEKRKAANEKLGGVPSCMNQDAALRFSGTSSSSGGNGNPPSFGVKILTADQQKITHFNTKNRPKSPTPKQYKREVGEE